jgi:hypothetical protein
MTGTLWPVLKNPTHSWLFFWSATEFKWWDAISLSPPYTNDFSNCLYIPASTCIILDYKWGVIYF